MSQASTTSTSEPPLPSTLRPYAYKEPWNVTAWDNVRMFGVQLLYTGGSGAIAKTAVAPLERIKLILQVQSLSSVPKDQQYRSLLDALRRIPREEGGLRALYRGNGANVLRLLPEVVFKFAINDQFKLMFAPVDGSPLGLSDKLAAGAATGVCKTLLFYPIDLCRVRISTDLAKAGQPRYYATIRSCLVTTIKTEGVFGCYKGLGMSLVGVVPYLSASFTAYDALKQQLGPADKRNKSQWWYALAKMGCGALAGVCAQTLTYPLDTVRRRMQVTGGAGQAIHHRSYINCVTHMWQHEGIRAFYRGVWANCLKTAPGAAVQFMAYDLIKSSIMLLDPLTVQSPL